MAGWLARLPVRARLTAWYVLLLAVILATLGSFLLLRLRVDLVAEVDTSLDTQAAGILADSDGLAVISGRPVAGLPRGDTVAQLLSPTGEVRVRAGTAAPAGSLLTPAMLRRVLAGQQVRAEVRPGPDRARYRVLGLRRAGGGPRPVLVVAAPLADVDASHELRTPLAVVRAELEVALRVDDLLTLAHRVENRLELLLVPVDLGGIAAEVAAQLRPLAEQGRVQLAVETPSVPVVADQARVTQVVTNLVDNAVKYTGAGGSGVRVWEEAGGGGLAVSDTGPGIGPEDLPKIFDRFFRLDAARTRARGGSGLGLAICKELVEAHGGRIWAESVPGAGSTFTLTLPGRPPAAAHRTAP